MTLHYAAMRRRCTATMERRWERAGAWSDDRVADTILLVVLTALCLCSCFVTIGRSFGLYHLLLLPILKSDEHVPT